LTTRVSAVQNVDWEQVRLTDGVRSLLTKRSLPDIPLDRQSSISFVIPSIGTRDEFIDKFLIPSILKQGISAFEIIIVGRYRGEYIQHLNVRYVPVSKFPVYFYMPFQKGVSETRYEWVASLGDDMALTDDWYSELLADVRKAGDADVYGFRVLNHDGSLCVDIADAFGARQAGRRIRPTSYFGSYIAKRAMFDVLPYPTYFSCDRHHAVLMSEYKLKRKFLPGVHVIHYATVGQAGAIPRASPRRYRDTMALMQRLGMLVGISDADYKRTALRWFRYASKIERRAKRIGIWGPFGHECADDELVLSSMVSALSQHGISVYTDSPEGVQKVAGIEHVFHTEELRVHLNELDLLLVGGGEILSNEAITGAFPRELMHSCETPIIVYAAGIPSFDRCNDLYYFLAKCYLVTARDDLCLTFVKQRFGDIPSLLLPDPAFMLQRLQCKRVPGKVVLTTRTVPEGWGQALPADVNEMLRRELRSIYSHLANNGYSPLVLGFESGDEEVLSNQGYQYKMVGVREAVEEIATAELLIGADYHSGVLAITQHTPAILLDYRKEMEGLKTLVSSGINVVNIENLNLVNAFEAFRQERHEYKPQEIEALKEMIAEFNDMYVNYVY
jgi:polysaccharide pyruvyl transferase WcaK-like protein